MGTNYIPPELLEAYVEWLDRMRIVPRYPYRSTSLKSFFSDNPDVHRPLDFHNKYPPDDPGPIVGRGKYGKKYVRKNHNGHVGDLRRDLYDSNLLSNIMRIHMFHFFPKYCNFRFGLLKDLRCMRRYDEDNLTSTKDLIRMKKFGLSFFIVRRLGIKKFAIKKFMMHLTSRMVSNENFRYIGFATGKMRNDYQFQFQHGDLLFQMPAFRFNFRHQFEILMKYPRELRFATRVRKLAKFIRLSCISPCVCFKPECSHTFKSSSYVFPERDFPEGLHPDSRKFVKFLSHLLFFHFKRRNALFAYDCCMREFVRIIFGFLIGTSKEKIESAVVDLFEGVFPNERYRDFFRVFFQLFERCDSFDPEFFKHEAHKMLSKSIASPATNYSISHQEMKLLKNEEVNLLKMERSPIQNILLFVLYWHQRHLSTFAFQHELCCLLKQLQEIF
jgi:hypothetical protein